MTKYLWRSRGPLCLCLSLKQPLLFKASLEIKVLSVLLSFLELPIFSWFLYNALAA